MGDPSDVGFRKESSNVALMVGSVFGEFFTFAPMPFDRNHMTKEEGEKVVEKVMGEKAASELLPLFEKAYPTHNPVDLTVLDTIVRVPLLDYVKERSKMNAQTYSYMFDLELPLDGGWVPWHCADIPYVLQTHHSRHIHRKQALQSASRQRFLTVLCHLRAQVIQTTAQFLIGRRAHQIISIHS